MNHHETKERQTTPVTDKTSFWHRLFFNSAVLSVLYRFSCFVSVSYTHLDVYKRQDDIWGLDSDTEPHTVDVHINRLRDRFRNNPDFEIITVRGLGYKVTKREDEK